MQSIRNSILGHLSVRVHMKDNCLRPVKAFSRSCRLQCSTSTAGSSSSYDLILGQVIGVVKDFKNYDSANKISEDTEFVRDLVMDSFDLVDLQMSFKEKLGFHIPDEYVNTLKSCGAVAKYITGGYERTNVEDQTSNPLQFRQNKTLDRILV